MRLQFNKSQVKSLGHIVGVDGVKVDPDNICGVADTASVHELRGFLGSVGWFHQHTQG